MPKHYTAEEREVHIWLDDIDRVWRADASIPMYIRKFQKAGWKQTKTQTNERGLVIYASFEAPAYGISIRNSKKVVHELTDEQKTAATERMKLARKQRKTT